jgi:hypothetical protein
MTQLILTSVQEAALNAAGEALTDLGLNCYLRRYGNGNFSVFGYPDETDKGPTIHITHKATMAEAMQAFIAKVEEERGKPVLIAKPAEVKSAVAGMIDELREVPSYDPALDELADKVAALAVKE